MLCDKYTVIVGYAYDKKDYRRIARIYLCEDCLLSRMKSKNTDEYGLIMIMKGNKKT